MSGVLIVILSVITVASAICRPIPSNHGSLSTSDGLFTLEWWRLNDTYAQFNVTATTAANTWAAIGFSNDILMPNTDVAIAGDNNVYDFVEDRWNGAVRANGPIFDTDQNLEDTSTMRIDGVLTFAFSRQIESDDDNGQDIDLSNCVWALWAYGGNIENFTTPAIVRRHARRGVFAQRLCLCAAGATTVVSVLLLLIATLVAITAIF